MSNPGLDHDVWSQGCLVRCSDLCFPSYKRNNNSVLALQSRRSKDTDYWIVISQDCDLARGENHEPYVEFMLCRPAKNETELEAARTNSARRFLVDEKGQLVALAPFRACVKKSDVADLQVEPWPGDKLSLEQFRQWLGWRYTRPAVPDDIDVGFQDPCIEVAQSLAAEDPSTLASLGRCVEEMKFYYFEAEPPYKINLVVLVREGFDPGELDASLNTLLDAWEANIDSSKFSVVRPPMILPEPDMPRGLDRISTKMDLDPVLLADETEGGAE